MNGYLSAMRNYATFRGRASRAEFWQFTVIMGVIAFAALIIDAAFISGPNAKAAPFATLVILAHALPTMAVSVRRLHDVDRSGWFLFINLIPLIGFVLLLVWACEAGTRGPNDFGPSPLDIVAAPLGGRASVSTTAVTAPPLPANRDGPDRLPNPQASPTDEVMKAMGAASVEAHAYNDQEQSYCESAAYSVDQLAKAADPASGVVKKDF